MACGTFTPPAYNPETCVLTIYNAAGEASTYNLFDSFLAKLEIPDQTSTLDYDPKSHTLTHNGELYPLTCGEFNFNPATCEISYTDEKCVFRSWVIPQDQFIYSSATCTLTILDAKGNPGIVIPTGVSMADVGLELVACNSGCALEFTYKDKVCNVPLPDMIVGCEYDLGTNTLRFIHCDGSEEVKALAKASMQCNTLDDGTRIIQFQDGCGGQKMFDLTPVAMDIDELTVTGSVLTFTSGGDGNPGVVSVDICDIVASNCNATITAQYADGGFDFVDNAGNPFTIRPANCCTFFGLNNNPIDPDNPPGQPAGNFPTKSDRDTLIECHPNGLSFWTCVGGAWTPNFTKSFVNNVHHYVNSSAAIDPLNPPVAPPPAFNPATKTDGDTAMVCYPNGFCAFTCVNGVWARQWCKFIPEVWNPTSTDGSVTITQLPNGDYDFSVEVVEPLDPEKETFKSGDTLPDSAGVIEVCLADGTIETVGPGSALPLTMVGCVQVDETDGTTGYIPPKSVATPLEIYIGTVEPQKSAGFTQWFDPETCIVRVCDNAGNWLEPRAVVCSATLPECVKGGPTLWFDLSTGCLNVQCEDEAENCVWVSATGSIVNQTLEALCIQVGGADPVPLEVVDGKAVIPIPAVPITSICTQVDGEDIGEDLTPINGKVVVPLPGPGCCHYNLGSTQELPGEDGLNQPTGSATKNDGDTALVKHPNGLSSWTCQGGTWQLNWTCPDAAIVEAFVKGDLFTSSEGQPATDGSAGCFWLDEDTGCPHILFNGVWIATNGSDTAA